MGEGWRSQAWGRQFLDIYWFRFRSAAGRVVVFRSFPTPQVSCGGVAGLVSGACWQTQTKVGSVSSSGPNTLARFCGLKHLTEAFTGSPWFVIQDTDYMRWGVVGQESEGTF